MAKRGEIEQMVYDSIKNNDGGSVASVARETTLSRAMVENAFAFLKGEGSITQYKVFGSTIVYKVVKK